MAFVQGIILAEDLIQHGRYSFAAAAVVGPSSEKMIDHMLYTRDGQLGITVDKEPRKDRFAAPRISRKPQNSTLSCTFPTDVGVVIEKPSASSRGGFIDEIVLAILITDCVESRWTEP